MIALAASVETLKNACPDDTPEGCRMIGFALAYGLDTSFFDAWVCTDGNGAPVAAITRLDGAGTAALSPGVDELPEDSAQEMAEFVRAVGVSSLLGEEKMLVRMGLSSGERAVAMTRTGASDTAARLEIPGITVEFDPSPRALYPLLSSAGGGITMPPFDGWYVDLSHRMRRSLAHAVLLKSSGEAVACAVSTGETEHGALLAGAATAAHARGAGLGAAAVRLLCGRVEAPGRRMCLLREENEHERFYRSLGFSGGRTLLRVREF